MNICPDLFIQYYFMCVINTISAKVLDLMNKDLYEVQMGQRHTLIWSLTEAWLHQLDLRCSSITWLKICLLCDRKVFCTWVTPCFYLWVKLSNVSWKCDTRWTISASNMWLLLLRLRCGTVLNHCTVRPQSYVITSGFMSKRWQMCYIMRRNAALTVGAAVLRPTDPTQLLSRQHAANLRRGNVSVTVSASQCLSTSSPSVLHCRSSTLEEG